MKAPAARVSFGMGTYIMTSRKGSGMDETKKGVSRRQFIETAWGAAIRLQAIC